MANQKSMVIPGIPLAALDAVSDANTKEVLRALIDAHHVRNGASGNGDEQFVTRKEVGLTNGHTGIGGGFGNNQSPSSSKGKTLSIGEISRLINDLQAQVLESPLFKELGTRIDLIDKPNGLIDQFKTIKDGVTQLTIESENGIIQTNAIKKTVYDPVTGLAAAQALIGEINDISATSSSASAKKLSLIDATVFDPVTGLAKTNAGIGTANEARVNNDNALAKAINTIWAAVGDNSALVQEGSESVVNNVGAVAQRWAQTQVAIKDPVTGAIINSAAIRENASTAINKAGELEAKYTIKLDVNGYVSGYGLMSTANNSVPFSEFIVRADRFAIGSPSGPNGGTPKVPFIVKTSDSYVNGVFSPAGTYMSNTFIENGSIANAKIGYAAIEAANIKDLEVTTLKIGNDAVTIPSYLSGGGGSSHSAGAAAQKVGSITVKYVSDVNIVAIVAWQVTCGASSTNSVIEVRVAGAGNIMGQGNSCLANFTSSFAGSGSARLSAGTYTFEVWVSNNWSSGTSVLNQWSVTLLGVMK